MRINATASGMCSLQPLLARHTLHVSGVLALSQALHVRLFVDVHNCASSLHVCQQYTKLTADIQQLYARLVHVSVKQSKFR